jgi:hypothetical protein
MAIGVVSYSNKPNSSIGVPRITPLINLGDDPTGGSGTTDSGLTSTSSVSGAGSLLNAKTNAAKFDAEQKAAAAAMLRQTQGAQAQETYLRGLLGKGVPASITGEIGAQETAGRNYINTTATNLLERLAGALTTGQGYTTQGYDTLRNYLAANPANAYANAAQAAPTVTQNTLANYMQAMGTPAGAVDASLGQVNAQATGGANAFNQLLNVLQGSEASGQASRLSEEQMARALAGSQLQSIYGSGRANVESEQLSALNALATQISNARIAAQQAQTAQETAIQNALAGLYGTGLVTLPPPVVPDGGVAPVIPVVPATVAPAVAPKPLTAVQQLAAVPIKASNKVLQNKINAFISSKPNASAAAVAKAFPQLAATILKNNK